jgi:oxygen-independent coproporphyrinogen III oxidase
MAGIYIHIPFCFTRCGYCDFYKTTNLSKMGMFLGALKDEIQLRSKNFDHVIDTVYFGGGTPSLVKPGAFEQLFDVMRSEFQFSENTEITIEANPDDIKVVYCDGILKSGFNRISIGIQSFMDTDLRQMGRRHNAEQALRSIETVKKAGFKNISIDLIYGLPWSDDATFSRNLEIFSSLDVQHLSAYHLTFEPGTSFYDLLKKGVYKEVQDSSSTQQYKLLCNVAKQAGMEHYEISNFCKPDYVSRHNSSYWHSIPYIGFGPGSHSYYDKKRRWNKPDLGLYVSGNFEKISEEEQLDVTDMFNESIMLGLRTSLGINLLETKGRFSTFYPEFITRVQKWLESKYVVMDDGFLKCTEEGWFLADAIIGDLFVEK